MPLQVHRLNGAIGAELSGVDLCEPLDDDAVTATAGARATS